MPELDVVAALHAATIVAAKLATPLLLASLAAGLFIAVIQAVTQISDATLSFLPKLAATGAAGWIAGPFLAQTMFDYMRETFDQIIRIGGS